MPLLCTWAYFLMDINLWWCSRLQNAIFISCRWICRVLNGRLTLWICDLEGHTRMRLEADVSLIVRVRVFARLLKLWLKSTHKLVLSLAFAIKVLDVILYWARSVVIRLNRHFIGFVVIWEARGTPLNTYGAIAVAYSGVLNCWFTFTRFDSAAALWFVNCDPFRYFRLFWWLSIRCWG